MTSPSLEISLNHHNFDITELGFVATETGFEDMKKEIMDFYRKGFRWEKRKVINLKGFPIDSPDANRYKNLYYLYCKIINLEANTDFLDNFY